MKCSHSENKKDDDEGGERIVAMMMGVRFVVSGDDEGGEATANSGVEKALNKMLLQNSKV